ncbi:SDR family NAD(P)-dependent oxidoreductase [Streptomyces sp. JCM17656]|nr:SDR family NAD(P)-dependent oxidoreductase [Streptomyces sp. JCM17656]
MTVLRDDAGHPATPPDTLVWLSGEGSAGSPPPLDALDAATKAAVTSLRDVLDLLSGDCSRLLVVTEDVYATGTANPSQALLHGFTLALPAEHPGLAARGVDLTSGDALPTQVDALERELYSAHESGAEATVAWRSGRRLIRTPTAVADDPEAPGELPPDGTYLITGGAGGLGSALARDLAGRGACELILTGRSETVPEDLLADLRAQGAHAARYHVADVSDEAAVDALFADLPPLDGVFHAAGTVRPGTLRSKSDAEIEQVLAAKVRGTALLAEALRRHGQEPAVRVAFSSVSSVRPGLAGALGDYAAANAFLDAFAAAERATGRPWQSIGFGPVSDAGLAAGSPVESRLRTRGLSPMTTQAAITALRTAVATDAAHLLVTMPERSAQAQLQATATPVSRTVPAPQRPTPTTLRDRTAPTGNPTRTADLIRNLLADALRHEPEEIGDDEQFLSLGLDSLTAVDLARRLETELGLPLPATLLFEHRTVGELSTHLATQNPAPLTAAPAHRPRHENTPRPLTPSNSPSSPPRPSTKASPPTATYARPSAGPSTPPSSAEPCPTSPPATRCCACASPPTAHHRASTSPRPNPPTEPPLVRRPGPDHRQRLTPARPRTTPVQPPLRPDRRRPRPRAPDPRQPRRAPRPPPARHPPQRGGRLQPEGPVRGTLVALHGTRPGRLDRRTPIPTNRVRRLRGPHHHRPRVAGLHPRPAVLACPHRRAHDSEHGPGAAVRRRPGSRPGAAAHAPPVDRRRIAHRRPARGGGPARHHPLPPASRRVRPLPRPLGRTARRRRQRGARPP